MVMRKAENVERNENERSWRKKGRETDRRTDRQIEIEGVEQDMRVEVRRV